MILIVKYIWNYYSYVGITTVMNDTPIIMENYFNPGFKTKPAVHVGSQTIPLFHGNAKEQAWEGCCLTAASKDDVAIVRNFDPVYLEYWKALMDKPYIINIEQKQKKELGKYLTEVVLQDEDIIQLIKRNMNTSSKLMVFLPTQLEQKLAKKLGIPLHGLPKIHNLFGTKSGIRRLSRQAKIPMAPGFICSTFAEIEEATAALSQSFETIIIKNDISLSGYFSKKLKTKEISDLTVHLDEIAGGKFIEGKDIVVLEGWLESEASLCVHIEILKGQKPIICAAWQQIIDSDGISYMGAGPLRLSSKAMRSLNTEVNKLADALTAQDAVGSYGPDFMVVDDSCVLIELNARVPYTAFPLEIIMQIKGKIGNGFLAKHIKLSRKTTFTEIQELLQKEKLLITEKNSNAKGVVPYNIGLLPWNLFDLVVMADSWEETLKITDRVNYLFKQ